MMFGLVSVVVWMRVQPDGVVNVGGVLPLLAVASTTASRTSFCAVPAGLLMVRGVAPFVEAAGVLAARNVMLSAPGQTSWTSHSFAAARQTAPALPGACTHWAEPTVPLQRRRVPA